MPLIQTSPPAEEPVTLAEAKAYLRIGHDDEDALISTLITAARRRAVAETGLAFVSQGWSLYLDGWPETGVIELPIGPLIAVSAVKTYGEDDTPAVIEPAHYYVDAVSRPPRLLLRGSRVWARPGRIGNGIEIAFTAGFGAASAVPADLRQAVLELVAHFYAHRGDEEASIPLTVRDVLAFHRGLRL
jgi:uncharacterized phiE125 gp8 family phage protein